MTTKTDEQLRAEFEAWHAGKYWAPLFDDELGRFIPAVVQKRWQAYQAGRAALQSQKPKANDLMLSAVLRMPFEMAMADPISRMQFYQRAQQALNELEALQSQDKKDAARFRKIMNMTRAEREEVLFFACDRDVLNAIDHARRIEGEAK